MLEWNAVDLIQAPKDRLILVTAGWGWRREDKTRELYTYGRRGANGLRTIASTEIRTYKTLKPIGAVVMVYWMVDETRKEGGLWVIAGNDAAFFQPFRWWADVNNPLSAEEMVEHDPTFLVSNHRPEFEAMTPYVPSADEIKQRKLLAMMGI